MVITTWRVNGHNISDAHGGVHKPQRKRLQNNIKTTKRTVRFHSPHHGNYIEGHEIQPAPVTCHRSNSFLSGNKHSSSLTAPHIDQRHLQNSEGQYVNGNIWILPWWCTSYWPQSAQTESLQRNKTFHQGRHKTHKYNTPNMFEIQPSPKLLRMWLKLLR